MVYIIQLASEWKADERVTNDFIDGRLNNVLAGEAMRLWEELVDS
jgi:hypothetical protein